MDTCSRCGEVFDKHKVTPKDPPGLRHIVYIDKEVGNETVCSKCSKGYAALRDKWLRQRDEATRAWFNNEEECSEGELRCPLMGGTPCMGKECGCYRQSREVCSFLNIAIEIYAIREAVTKLKKDQSPF